MTRVLGLGRILVAEDNPTNQFVIRQLLQTAGHLPQLVGDGGQALRMLEREDFDLVLIDMHLPELDGCEVVTHYRQQHPGSVLPIVMLTADATPTAAERAYAAGVTAHLTKPITVDRLLEVIEQLATGPDTAVKRLVGQPPDGLSTELRLLCPEQLNQFRRRMPGQDVVDRLIDTYRCDAAHYLERIEQHVACAAWEDAGDVAHALRSASATVGAERVMALCQQLEEAAQMARSTEELPALAEQLRLALTATYAALEDYRRTLDFPMN